MEVHCVNRCDFGVHAVTTHDRNVFSFFPDHRPCKGFEEALSRYKELAPRVCLAGRSMKLKFQVLWCYIELEPRKQKVLNEKKLYKVAIVFTNLLDLMLDRTYFLCTYHRSCHRYCCTEWLPVPCTINNSRWPGLCLWRILWNLCFYQ
jgi:hypothetical protein